MGGSVKLEQGVQKIEHDEKRITAVVTQQGERFAADAFFSTMPLQALINALTPAAPADVIAAAQALQYRGLITINLVIDKATVIPDHWLYVHEKSVRMGRIGNMNNFSLKMVANEKHTGLCLEYFAFVGEPFWQLSDQELLKIGAQELEKLNIVKAAAVIDGMVLKTAEAYPVYDQNYHTYLGAVLNYLKQFDNLYLMGRNGMHRYNNMDVAMLSAMHAVENYKKQQAQVPAHVVDACVPVAVVRAAQSDAMAAEEVAVAGKKQPVRMKQRRKGAQPPA
jgi:protoporphyrinogen oxidase